MPAIANPWADGFLRAAKQVRLRSFHRPLDLRIFYGLIAFAAGWKFISLDYSAVAEICGRDSLAIFRPIEFWRAFHDAQCTIFPSSLVVKLWTFAGAAFLLASVIWVRRLLIALAFLCIWTVDTAAFTWRVFMWDIDTPLMLMLIMILAPVNLKTAMSLSPHRNGEAALLGMSLLVFVGGYYVLAGISKIVYIGLDWPLVVDLGNYYLTSTLFHAQELPGYVEWLAHSNSWIFTNFPAVDFAAALLVLIEQFLWIGALFSLWIRYHVGVFTAGYHVVIALTTGIIFFAWPFITLGIAVPWALLFSHVRRRTGFGRLKGAFSISDRSTALPMFRQAYLAIPLCFVLFPVFFFPIPPMQNYMQFGWRYPAVAEYGWIYRIGFGPVENPETFPLNQGGFLEYRHANQMDLYTNRIVTSEGNDPTSVEALRTMLLATRGPRPSGGLLPNFLTAPDHLLSDPGDVDMRGIRQFYLMRGEAYSPEGHQPAEVNWTVCGTFNMDVEGIETVQLNGNCPNE